MDQFHFSKPVANTISILGMNNMEIGTAIDMFFVILNAELPVFQTFFTTLKQKPLTSGSDRSLSDGTRLTEHYGCGADSGRIVAPSLCRLLEPMLNLTRPPFHLLSEQQRLVPYSTVLVPQLTFYLHNLL